MRKMPYINSTGPKFILSHLRGPSDIHRSNIIPTGAEQESLEASIASAFAEAAQLDDEIVRLQTILETLTERRDTLYRFAKQEQGLFSPIRKLPADVLRQIFLIVHAEDQEIFCDDLEAFPRIVTQVSSFWRSVAHACAPMWSTVYATNYQEQYGSTYGDLIQKCITFSNQLPLTVVLQEGCTPSSLGSDCVRALGQCAYRWQSMMISDAELSKSIFACIPADASFYELKNLDLHVSSILVINPSPKLTRLSVTGVLDPSLDVRIFAAEQLVEVTLKNIIHPLSTFVGMPWVNIIQFDAIDIDYRSGELFDLLEKMKNLVSLSLKEATEAKNTGSLSLPHLASLSISDEEETNVLEILTTPNLRNLSLKCDLDPDFIVDFAVRSKFSLELLELSEMDVDASFSSPEFANLKCFYWEKPRSVANGIEWLTNYDVPSPAEIFPHLEWLHISKVQYHELEDLDEDWSVEAIIRMLASRIQAGADDPAITGRYLKRAFISFLGFLRDKEAASFKEFFHSEVVRTSGVTITVTDGGGTCIRTL